MITLKKYQVSLVQPIVSVYPLVTTIILVITKVEVIGLLVMVGTPVLIIGVAVVSSSNGNGGVKFEIKGMIMALIVALFWRTTIFSVRFILLVPGTEAIGLTGIRVAQIGIGALIVYLFTKKYDDNTVDRNLLKSNLIFHSSELCFFAYKITFTISCGLFNVITYVFPFFINILTPMLPPDMYPIEPSVPIRFP